MPAQVGSIVAWTFGLAPALLFLLTWSVDLSPWQQLTRGYALPVLAAELAIIIVSFREGLALPRPRPIPLMLLAGLGIVSWTTAATAAHPTHALLRTAAWTVHLAFALALVNLWQLRMLDLKQHLRALLVGFLLFFGLLVAFIATTEQTSSGRVFGLPAFGHVRWFGYYAAAVTGLSALGFLRGDRFGLVVAAFAFAMAFWTGTRGAVGAALVGFVACAIVFRDFRMPRTWLLFALSGVAGLVLALGLDTIVPIGAQGPDSMARAGVSGRFGLWQTTLEHAWLRPWFGWGEGQVPFLFAGLSFIPGQPHNVVVQVLHAWGIVGGLLCVALAIWATPAFLKGRHPVAAPFQCAAIILAAYSFMDGTLYYSQSLSLFALCCAAAVAAGMPEPATSGLRQDKLVPT